MEADLHDVTEWLSQDPFGLDRTAKEALLSKRMDALTCHHYENCPPYRGIVDALGGLPAATGSSLDTPYLPVRLFKDLDLRSVEAEEVVKTMTSSGTTGQAVSRIYLDRGTATNQTKVLTRLVSTLIGSQRLPMIIIDSEDVVKDRTKFSARGAGILGFSMFARDKVYALDSDMRLNLDALQAFLAKHEGKPLFAFGFTFMIWQHFYTELARSGVELDLSQATLIHGGGWKKLAAQAVSTHEFREALRQVSGLRNIHDYYGMVEQTGSIYLECEQGHLHTSIFSHVVIRRPFDFSPAAVGEQGLIQVLSVLPVSYPGHSLLTEDEGVLLGEDDCPCGRLGKYFAVLGRIKNAELRGCSDTYTPVLGQPVGVGA